jgi:hypothetical protein
VRLPRREIVVSFERSATMSFDKLVRDYINENNEEISQQSPETLVQRSARWIRKVAGPAALGLSLSFGMGSMVGCGGIDEGPVAQALVGKGDGAGCYGDSDCGPNQVCEGYQNSCPEGAYCILPPTPGQCVDKVVECYGDSDCGPNQVCEGAGSQCPEGAYCVLPPTPGQCVDKVADCSTNGDCDPGQHCEGAGGQCPEGAYCILPPTPGQCVANTACSADDDCGVGQKCKVVDNGGGNAQCPEGAYCILPPTPQGVCENECSVDSDCAVGERCVTEVTGECPEGAYCILPPTPTKGLCEL